MKFKIGKIEVRIDWRSEESEEVKAILRDPQVDALLEKEELVEELRDYIKSKSSWISEDELREEYPQLDDLDQSIWYDIRSYNYGFFRKTDLKREVHDNSRKKHFYKYEESWGPGLIFLLLVSLTTLNLITLIWQVG